MNQSVVSKYSLGGFYDVVYRISSVHGSPLRGLCLNLSILNFLNNFFHGIWSRPSERRAWSRPSERAFFSEWNTFLFNQKMWPYSWVIGCQKWPFCIFYGIFIENSCFQPHVAHEQVVVFWWKKKWHSTQKKRLFQMAYFKFHKKNYWESSKLQINPSR